MYEQTILQQHVENIGNRLETRVGKIIDALHELERMTLFLFRETPNNPSEIDAWLDAYQFQVDADGFYQSAILVETFHKGETPADAISCSWGKHLATDPVARFRMFSLRNIGSVIAEIHKRLPYVAWIYYQDNANVALEYPFIDQKSAITSDFDWHQYHTFLSVNPTNDPEGEIRWTQPSIDYAGKGLILSVSKPLYIENRIFTGLWSIDVPIRNLHADFIRSHIFYEQDTFIVDSQGLFISHNEIPFHMDREAGSVFRETIGFLGNGFKELKLEQIEKTQSEPFLMCNNEAELVVCARRIPSLDWILFSTVPRSVLSDAVSQRVQNVISNISKGNLSERITTDALPDHWQALVEAMNDMSESLEIASARESHLNEVLRSIRSINQLLIVEKDTGALIQSACDTLLKTRDYKHAWIVLLNENNSHPKISEAALGRNFEPLQQMLENKLFPEYCKEALSQADVVRTHISDEEPSDCPISKHFPCSVKLTVRLAHDDNVYGLLSITVDNNCAEESEELSLVNQLAGDIGLALHGIAMEAAQKKTASALQILNEELEERVQMRTAQLEAANEELEAFSYSVSHDLRAPLRAIGGFSSILLDDYKDKLDDDGKEALGRIINAVKQMGLLIDDLLKLSRIMRYPVHLQTVNLNGIIEKIIETLRRGEPERNVSVEVEPDMIANGDPTLLYVILQNLLDNAWKFTAKNEDAKIICGKETLEQTTTFFVSDNGAGFDKQYAEKLFDAFQRLHDAREYRGTGIGLAVAARAVKRQGGKIWARGEPDEGASFYFELPSNGRKSNTEQKPR